MSITQRREAGWFVVGSAFPLFGPKGSIVYTGTLYLLTSNRTLTGVQAVSSAHGRVDDGVDVRAAEPGSEGPAMYDGQRTRVALFESSDWGECP